MDPVAFNVATGLTSAAIAAAAGYTWRSAHGRRRARRLEREFPVSGTYKAVYTENVAHNALRVRDTIRIFQDGQRITGQATAVGTGRTFDLVADIIDDRYLSGTYRGHARGDSGLGVFFMSLDGLHVGRLNGLWAGFGGELHDVLSGSWLWSKLEKPEIAVIEDPSAPEVASASAFLNDYLGTGYVALDQLRARLESGLGILVCARHSGALAGAATAEVLRPDETKRLREQLAAAGCRRVALEGHTAGVLKSSAVVPSMRGRGIGLALVRERLLILVQKGCTVAYTFAWDSGERESSQGVLEAAGFEFVVEIPHYWQEPSGAESFECVKCGTPCTCTAIVMRKSLI